MADHVKNLSLSSISLLSLERIDTLCGEFEEQLGTDRPPRIEDFLKAEAEDENRVLLREMLHLELSHKKSLGLSATQVEYETRFSKYKGVVREAFGESPKQKSERRDYTGRRIDDRYKVGSLLGSGAFSDVYLAEDLQRKRPVALKLLKSDCGIDVTRLLDEAKMLAGLNHPNIAGAYDWGTDGDTSFIVLQFIDGTTLADAIANKGPMTSEEVVRLAAKICDALHLAHQSGLTHRDVKPQNILLDRGGEPFVADFGFALHESTQDQHFGDRSGTPYYRAPEQVRGEADWIDGRADIWAVGVMLYEMLTGRKPFKGDSISEIDRQILGRSPRPLRQIDSSIPEWLEAITQKCLAPSPADRYATASGLAEALRNKAHPGKSGQLSRKWKTLVGALVLVLSTSAVGSFLFARHQRSKARMANEQAKIANVKTQKAIEQTIRDVEGPLRNLAGPGNEAARRQLIENSIANADKGLSDSARAMPLKMKMRLMLADFIIEQDDSLSEARDLLDECIQIASPFIESSDGPMEKAPYLRLLGDVHDKLGQIDRSESKTKNAIVEFERALAYRMEWVEIAKKYKNVKSSAFMGPARQMAPEIFDITELERAQQSIAKSNLQLGQYYRHQPGQSEKALACFRALADARRDYFQSHPTLPITKQEYGGALRDVASELVKLGRYEEAESNYRESLRLTAEVIEDYGPMPGVAKLYGPKLNLGMFSRELAELLILAGRTEEAGVPLQDALAQLNRILPEYKDDRSFTEFTRARLRNCHYWRGIQQLKVDPAAAAVCFESCLQFSEGSEQILPLARLHRRSEADRLAVEAWQELTGDVDSNTLFLFAQRYSVCAWSAREEANSEDYAKYRDNAIAYLEDAIAGVIPVTLIRDHPDLQVLQEDSDFVERILKRL